MSTQGSVHRMRARKPAYRRNNSSIISTNNMVFPYYHRLSTAQKRVYRRSDEIASIRLPQTTWLPPLVTELAAALTAENEGLIQTLCQRLVDGITYGLKVRPIQVEVLAIRPRDDWGELHGLYSPEEGRRKASIQLWMRTAQRRHVVAFKTFLRTLLHELCHHLDYELLQLPDSFHTEGFYKRVSSLFRQLVRAEET